MPTSIIIVLILLLISVTYFHEMRSEDRATGTGERMKEWKTLFLQLTFQSELRSARSFPLIFAADEREMESGVCTMREIGKVKNYANLKKKSWIFSDGIWIFWLDLD